MAPINVSWSSGIVVTSLLTGLSQGATIGRRADVPAPYVAAPYYPAPYTGWIPSWSDSVQKAKALVDTMTLAEKANITAGTGIFMGKCFREWTSISHKITNLLQSKCNEYSGS